MHTIRVPKSYYFAAFILGAALALLILKPARAADVSALPPPAASIQMS